jgi:hypothetical protein
MQTSEEEKMVDQARIGRVADLFVLPSRPSNTRNRTSLIQSDFPEGHDDGAEHLVSSARKRSRSLIPSTNSH